MAPGNGLKDLQTNGRLIGGYNQESTELAAEFIKTFTKGQVQITDLATAEVSKLAENAFRYVNIAFANELALLCKEIGADVVEVIRLANTHPRVNIHKPGCGAGGPCLSKDTHLLLNSVRSKNFKPEVILAAIRLNRYMPRHVAELAIDSLSKAGKSVTYSKIAIFGTAYKGDVNDARDSPAEGIINELKAKHANIVVYDPYCDESFGEKKAKSITEAVKGTDCIIIATDHKTFCKLNLRKIKLLMEENPIIVDGKRMVNPSKAEEIGFKYVAVSRVPRNSN